MDKTIKIAVLFSGNGTNLENIIHHFQDKKINGRRISILPITNRSNALGIEKAAKYKIKSEIIDHKLFQSREEFDTALVKKVQSIKPDLVVLAGFMRILTPIFTSNIKAINLHPSLLPLFKGADAIRESFESGMKVGGVTVHWVSSSLDGGEIIDQICVKINIDDTLESFEKKVHEAEYTLLPKVIANLLRLQVF